MLIFMRTQWTNFNLRFEYQMYANQILILNCLTSLKENITDLSINQCTVIQTEITVELDQNENFESDTIGF